MSDAIYNKQNPFLATVRENRLLNGPGSAKETRHYVVDIAGSGLVYQAGDSLGVFPANRSEEVREILERLDASPDHTVTPKILKESLPLGEALTGKLSLAGPTSKFLQFLRTKASGGEADRLDALLALPADELKTYLAERHLIDVLEEFPQIPLTPEEFCDHLRRLVPRLYSIASSPRLFPDEIHLTVATVRYNTNGRSRVGVCSTFLSDRVNLGQADCPVFVSSSHFRPPEDDRLPMIMVGPGTGIAPFRAFLQERKARGATGPNWLFFGDQHQSCDFLYAEEFEQAAREGLLSRLDLAFSRDQEHKIYVQDRMMENAAELYAWLQDGAYFYVCGDAKRMAKDVDEALHKIFEQEGGMSPEGARHAVKALKQEKRYQRDVY